MPITIHVNEPCQHCGSDPCMCPWYTTPQIPSADKFVQNALDEAGAKRQARSEGLFAAAIAALFFLIGLGVWIAFC